MVRQLQAAGEAHLQALLARGVERGEIDPALYLELTAFVLVDGRAPRAHRPPPRDHA